jgi:8-oxo-dGTP pyrophosphatase MutT (NUDIX family)
MEKLDPRVHFVVVTGIVVKDDKFLILKRAAHEKAYPNMWTVPGGKVVRDEYSKLPHTGNTGQWYNAIEWVLRKEIREEAGIEIKKPEYLCDIIFVRPDGFPTVILSYFAEYESGEVKVGKDLTDSAWITIEEAKNYEIIEGILDEIKEVDKILKSRK